MITPPAPSAKDTLVIPSGFLLEGDLAEAYRRIDQGTETLFLTGRAGTGKSTLLNYFRKNTKKNHVVLAPTGLAALHVGGSTIHSFFGFPLRPMLKNDPEIRAWSKSHPRLKILVKMDTLIIDEVSMVRADILDAIDQSLRLNLHSDAPFAGKQVIFIGDVFQLPPVVTAHDRIAENDDDELSFNPYFFNADAFRACLPGIVELRKIYRQQDEDFIYVLNRIRTGAADESDLALLNERYQPEEPEDEDFAITLTSVNALADRVNLQKLLELRSPSFVYKGTAEGVFDERLYPAPHALQLKVGAQVMMVKNDLYGRWVNGSIGIIDHIAAEKIIVRFATGASHPVEPAMWENKTYAWDKKSNTISFVVQGTYRQYPIRLAWAITIHKSQGLTFDKVIIDMGAGAFAHGQLYVALSRCRTLAGIALKTKIKGEDMIVDEAVEHFARKEKFR